MDRSRMIFLTVQSQIQRLQADVLYGLPEQLAWTERPWEKVLIT